MDHVHTYVLSATHCNIVTLPNEDNFEDVKDVFHHILLGGNQLTVARARGSIAVREDYDSSKQRLDGLLPTVEDWHAKQCLLKVWLACTTISCGHIAMFCCRLYGSNYKKSGSEKATLLQLRIIQYRSKVTSHSLTLLLRVTRCT